MGDTPERSFIMEEKFKEIAARYCKGDIGEITDEMAIREDLGLSSLDLMTFLGDLEDEFDIEFDLEEDEQKLSNLRTVGDALCLLNSHMD